MNEPKRLKLYDTQIASTGFVDTTAELAERYVAARTPKQEPSPERPGLVRITAPSREP